MTRTQGIRIVVAALLSCLAVAARAQSPDAHFTVAVIPDTQNYLDFHNQRAEGFPFDAREIFIDQMAYVERHLRANGGAIAFV